MIEFFDSYKCYESSLLELWDYNENIINDLSDQDILDAVNSEPLIR